MGQNSSIKIKILYMLGSGDNISYEAFRNRTGGNLPLKAPFERFNNWVR